MSRAYVGVEHLMKAWGHATAAWDAANHELLLAIVEVSNAYYVIRPRRIA